MRDPNIDKLKSKTLASTSGSFNEDNDPQIDDNKFVNMNINRLKSGTVIMRNPT